MSQVNDGRKEERSEVVRGRGRGRGPQSGIEERRGRGVRAGDLLESESVEGEKEMEWRRKREESLLQREKEKAANVAKAKQWIGGAPHIKKATSSRPSPPPPVTEFFAKEKANESNPRLRAVARRLQAIPNTWALSPSPSPTHSTVSSTAFASFPLSEEMKKGLESFGFEKATAIQVSHPISPFSFGVLSPNSFLSALP